MTLSLMGLEMGSLVIAQKPWKGVMVKRCVIWVATLCMCLQVESIMIIWRRNKMGKIIKESSLCPVRSGWILVDKASFFWNVLNKKDEVYNNPEHMGICENSDDKNIIYTTKSLLNNHISSNTTRFYFSTEPISKLDAECALFFSNSASSITKNVFISRLISKDKADKISFSYKNYMGGRKLNQGDSVVFSINISGLEFTKIAVMYLPQKKFQAFTEKKETRPTNKSAQKLLQKCMQSILKENVASLIVCEFDWKSWIVKSNGFKCMAKVIHQFPSLKAVVFACQSEDAQTMYMEAIQDCRKTNQKL